MTVYNWLCLFGVPTIMLALIVLVVKVIIAIKKGMQALLRAEMIKDYNHYTNKGYAPIYAKENFENCYINYHNLGANGVMTDIYNKFLALPTEPKEGD